MKNKKIKCELCKTKIPHLLVTVIDGDMHVHAPFENKQLMQDMLDTIQLEWDKARA